MPYTAPKLTDENIRTILKAKPEELDGLARGMGAAMNTLYGVRAQKSFRVMRIAKAIGVSKRRPTPKPRHYTIKDAMRDLENEIG